MKLEDWMYQNKMTQTDLAKAMSVQPPHIHNLLRGRHQPKPEFAKRLKALTNNQVSLDEIYDIPRHEDQKLAKLARDSKAIFQSELESPNSVIVDMMCERILELMKGKLEIKKEEIVEENS